MNQDLLEAPDAKMRGQIKVPTLILMHVLAGRSILTVRSRKTGERYTFRFSRPDLTSRGNRRPVWVSVYGGEQGGFTKIDTDRRNWHFLGTIWTHDHRGNALEPLEFNSSPKSTVPYGDLSVRAARWIAQHLPARADELMEKAEWWHEGVCGRCGRRLTVPESIDIGFGPDCAEKVGLGGVERVS